MTTEQIFFLHHQLKKNRANGTEFVSEFYKLLFD